MKYSGFIYIWTNNLNNMKYIGSHMGTIDDGYTGSGQRFLRAFKKYGSENFTRNIIRFIFNIDNIKKVEQYYLDLYNVASNTKFYNISQLATGSNAWKNFDEDKKNKIREKISKSRIGLTWEILYGKEKSDKLKKEMSKRLTGAVFSKEHKAKIGRAHKNKIVSKQTREKMRQIALNRPPDSKETKYKKGSDTRGKHYYNNGISEYRYFEGTQPCSWVRGRLDCKKIDLVTKTLGMKLYNNGIKIKLFYPDKVPDGWYLGSGGLKKTYSGKDNSASKAVVINNIYYETKKEAMRCLNVRHHKLKTLLKKEGNYEVGKKKKN